jgi:hypothetical protein
MKCAANCSGGCVGSSCLRLRLVACPRPARGRALCVLRPRRGAPAVLRPPRGLGLDGGALALGRSSLAHLALFCVRFAVLCVLRPNPRTFQSALGVPAIRGLNYDPAHVIIPRSSKPQTHPRFRHTDISNWYSHNIVIYGFRNQGACLYINYRHAHCYALSLQ